MNSTVKFQFRQLPEFIHKNFNVHFMMVEICCSSIDSIQKTIKYGAKVFFLF